MSCPSPPSSWRQPGTYAGVACLGVVIRGETDHYDFVCAEAARGIQDVQLETGVPCAFGVITCDTMEQALARAGGDKRDQGRNAALTAARMALMKRGPGLTRAAPATMHASLYGQGMSQLRQGTCVRQLPEPLDGRHQAALRSEPAEGPDRRGRRKLRTYVCTRCLKANKVVKAA